MLETGLAPCPYCKSHRLHLVVAAFTHKVVCEHCRCSGPQRRSSTDAITEWNRVGQSIAGFGSVEMKVPQQPIAVRH